MRKRKINSFITILLLASVAMCLAMDSKTVKINDSPQSPANQAMEILKSAAENESPLIRMDAIESIVISRCSKLFPMIDKSLADPVDAVRFAAALAVGDLRYKESKEKVLILFDSQDMNEKIAAAYALLRLGGSDNEYHKVIVTAIQSNDSTISANAALIIGKLGIKKYSGLLRWALQADSSDDKTRIQAIESLAMLKEKDVISKAWALMISKRADDRVMGIITMYHLGTYDSLNAIKTMLDDEVLEVRLVAAGRLEAFRDDTGTDVITSFFDKDIKGLSGEDRTRPLVHALDAVRYSRSLKLAEYLPQYLKDDDITVRIHSAAGILSISNGK